MGIIVGMNSRTGGKSSGSSITYFPGENIEFDGTSIKVAITQSAGATYTEGSGVTIAQEDKPATGADLNALLLYIKELESRLDSLTVDTDNTEAIDTIPELFEFVKDQKNIDTLTTIIESNITVEGSEDNDNYDDVF